MKNKQAVSLVVLMAFQFIHTCLLVFHGIVIGDIIDDSYLQHLGRYFPEYYHIKLDDQLDETSSTQFLDSV